MSNLYYRPDIDGLRAIAVLSIVLFHAEIAGFQGGFVGVDIFFVISGYLISSLILKDLASNSFSFSAFYRGRARRILPAFLAMASVISIVSWFTLADFLLPVFFKTLVSSVLFYSNIYFQQTVDNYWGIRAETTPLLHTWSLSVEEQFYLFFPLLLWGLWKHFSKKIQVIIWFVLILSFSFGLYFLKISPSAAFYLMPLRIWELLLGTVLALNINSFKISNRFIQELLATLGLLSLLMPVLFFSDSNSFPGWSALAPCLGTALLVAIHQNGRSWVHRLLSNPLFVATGLMSYSLYLWHWPILCLGRQVDIFSDYFSNTTYVFLLLTVLFSFLSWKYIERPFRFPPVMNKPVWRLWLGLGSASLFLIIINGIFITQRFSEKQSGITELLKRRYEAYETFEDFTECEYKKVMPAKSVYHYLCLIGDKKSSPSFAFIGDSLAYTALPAMAAAARESQKSGYVFIAPGCLSYFPGIHRKLPQLQANPDNPFFYEQCDAFADRSRDFLKKHTELQTVIFLARWEVLIRTSKEIRETAFSDLFSSYQSRRLFFLGPLPCSRSQLEHLKRNQDIFNLFDSMSTKFSFYFINLDSLLCTWSSCGQKNKRIFLDNVGHLKHGTGTDLLIEPLKNCISSK